MKRMWFWIAGTAGLALLLAIIYSVTAYISFLVLLDAKGRVGVTVMNLVLPSNDILEMFEDIPDEVMQAMEDSRAWCDERPPAQWTLQSRDGLQLNGWYFENPEPSHSYVIYCHGHGMKGSDFFIFTQSFAEQGFSVLFPDARAHGESEGRYRGMGWLDTQDLIDWAGLIIERDPQAEIMLAGISMGGNTVLNAAGETLPPQVKCIVSDCPFTSVSDEIEAVLHDMFKIPVGGLTKSVGKIVQKKAGFSITEASTLEQVKKATLPLLIFHGEEDDFVPFRFGKAVYEAAASADKQFYPVAGAIHGESAIRDFDGYMSALFGFARRNMPQLRERESARSTP
ncbi:MAG: lysophospholipase [Oscillospiraceae bacterium]|nr:lysophospholipase [Oscillospiraceae bacterium]